MTIKLFYADLSPAARAVNMTIHSLGLDVDFIHIDMLNKENMKPEFTKVNPQQRVPVLDDDGFILGDSHAINQYLVSKYGKDDDPLYPKDLQKRAKVDQRLHNSNDLFYVLRRITSPVLIEGKKFIFDEDKKEAIQVIYESTEKYLEGNKWIAGDTMTIGDFHYISIVASIIHCVPPEEDRYPNLRTWMENCAAEIPDYETTNKKGADWIGQCVMELVSSE